MSTSRRSPWPWAIITGLALVVLANAAYIVVALRNSDPVAESYISGKR